MSDYEFGIRPAAREETERGKVMEFNTKYDETYTDPEDRKRFLEVEEAAKLLLEKLKIDENSDE